MENQKDNTLGKIEQEISFEELEQSICMEEWKHIMYCKDELGYYSRIPSQPRSGNIILKAA